MTITARLLMETANSDRCTLILTDCTLEEPTPENPGLQHDYYAYAFGSNIGVRTRKNSRLEDCVEIRIFPSLKCSGSESFNRLVGRVIGAERLKLLKTAKEIGKFPKEDYNGFVEMCFPVSNGDVEAIKLRLQEFAANHPPRFIIAIGYDAVVISESEYRPR